jgi:general nucleoside transport system permease protein
MRLVLEKRAERSAMIAIASPLIAIALTLATMAILFAALGKHPVTALAVYFIDPLTDGYSLVELVVKATPLVMIAVGLALCYLANVWNIGAEGQFLIGAVCGSWLAVKTQGTDAGAWVLPAMLALGALGGALYALIPAIAKVRFGASEILTSLMLVYVADLLLDYLVRGPWRDPHGFNFPTTAEFDAVATVPILIEETRLHLGALIALVVVAAAAVLVGRTIMGFEIRVVGAAPRAARFAGFDADRLVIITFALSGALAGLAGIIEAAGPVGHLQPNFSPGYGFTAIIVAFLGRLNPLGILVAGLFLPLTFIGGEQAQISIKVPLNLTKVFQGILLFYVLACDSMILYRIRLVSSRHAASTAAAPVSTATVSEAPGAADGLA